MVNYWCLLNAKLQIMLTAVRVSLRLLPFSFERDVIK